MADKDKINDSGDNSWLGRKGFDEARYYNDENFEISKEQPDERIRQKVLETLSRNLNISEDEIEVNVKDGIVSLNGSVRSQQEKDEAATSIHELSGIKEVRNHLHFQD